MKAVINFLFAITMLGAIDVHAQNDNQECSESVTPTTPNERFVDNGDGTVSDKRTGLIWMRCALGGNFERGFGSPYCSGIAEQYTWQRALQAAEGYTYAGSSAWRVPDINQLLSIVETSCDKPWSNLAIFPNSDYEYMGNYWTSSPYAINYDEAWSVDFWSGYEELRDKNSDMFVRLVRQGAADDDGDGIADEIDNCPLDSNSDQLNTDGDALGNECDPDDDNDGIPDEEDDNPLDASDAVTLTIGGQIENGTISPSQIQFINTGKAIEFTVIANVGYYPHISGCDGSLVGTKFTIDPVDEDCTITLSFKLPTAPQNDTGITRCGNADNNDLDCPQADFPGQDAEYGRDVTHNDDSDGHAGFSFTKICNSGEAAGEGNCPADPALGSGDNEWGCTRDNVTDLMWEVKTDDDGLRDKDNTYTWYNSDSNTNGGDAGTENGGTCPDVGNCDTEKYAVSVNAVGLCGYNDWRMPSLSELLSIVHSGANNPAIDTVYFPGTISSRYWTASTYSGSSNDAWIVRFGAGSSAGNNKFGYDSVRLVRMGSE